MNDLRIVWAQFGSSWLRPAFLIGAVIFMALAIAEVPGGELMIRIWILAGVLVIGRDNRKRHRTRPDYPWRIYLWDALLIIGFLGLAAVVGLVIASSKP